MSFALCPSPLRPSWHVYPFCLGFCLLVLNSMSFALCSTSFALCPSWHLYSFISKTRTLLIVLCLSFLVLRLSSLIIRPLSFVICPSPFTPSLFSDSLCQSSVKRITRENICFSSYRCCYCGNCYHPFLKTILQSV